MRRIALLLIVPLALAGCSRGEAPWAVKSFAWEGRLDDGRWIRVKNTNGPVEVREATDGVVRVMAEKRGGGRRPEPVRFAVDSGGSGITVCALWGKRAGECSESNYRSRNDAWWKRMVFRRKSVSVSFVVHVPSGVRVDVQTINGKVEVTGAGGEVRARTVNGSVETSTSVGPIDASTVNGAIRAHIGAMDGPGRVKLSTVNGSVTADLPDGIGARIELSTVNGRIDSDLPITMEGAMNPKKLRGIIGDGTHQVEISTVNGSVTLRRS